MSGRDQTGRAAEEIVARSYEAEGGRVRARRWRCAAGEIDLIVECAGALVFVEVKARRRHDDAAAAIGARQAARIALAGEVYLAEHGWAGECRIDVVLVDRRGACRRIENAFDGGAS